MTSTLRLLVVWLGLAPLILLAQPGTGAIGGRVSDEGGIALPGVRVTVLAAAVAKTIDTGPDGRFLIPGLPVGSYRVRAELNTFRPASIERVEVRAGAPTEVSIKMRPGIIMNADTASPTSGLASGLHEADEVLHVRVRSLIGSGPLGRDARIVGTQYEATVLETIKPGTSSRPPGSLVKFWQHDAGRVVEEGRNYMGQFRVVAPGETAIVLLRKNPAEGLDTYADKRFLYSTAKGVVTSLFSSSDTNLPNGTPVDKAIETLRALIKTGDR